MSNLHDAWGEVWAIALIFFLTIPSALAPLRCPILLFPLLGWGSSSIAHRTERDLLPEDIGFDIGSRDTTAAIKACCCGKRTMALKDPMDTSKCF